MSLCRWYLSHLVMFSFGIMLHGGPVVASPQGFPHERSPAQMLTADAFVDFKQYAFPSTSIDTLEEWNGKSSSVKFSFDQDVRASPLPDDDLFFWIIGDFSLSEVIVYGGHPVVAVPDGECS